MYKIITFVPILNANKLRKAIGDAGAGKLGNYHHASFSTKGIGRFIPDQGANPAIGKIGKLEEVREEKIEVVCEKNEIKVVVAAIKQNHPYEEVPIEIYKLISEEEI